MSDRHVSIGMTPTEDTTRIPMYLDVSRIVEAVSPHVTLTQTDDGVVITVEDIDGTKTATVYRGPEGPKGDAGDPGERGEPGQDGFSPTVTITEITGGHRITITDATGAHSADVMDGKSGVTDVTVGGYSIVRGGVAQVKVSNGLRISNNNDRAILINEANQAMIKSRSNLSVITPSNQNASVFYGLATAAGDSTQSASSNPVGTYTDDAKAAIQAMLDVPSTDDIPEVPVTDVQVNGTSIVTDGVANVPVTSDTPQGLVPWNKLLGVGLYKDNYGYVRIAVATLAQIKQANSNVLFVGTSSFYQAAFYGLAKAAGDTTQSQSTNPVGQYTDEAKSAISQMLNAPVTVTGTTPTITALSGVRYVCGEVTTLDIVLPASGIVDVVFACGSTPTALTITPATGRSVTWANGFDPSALEAWKVYEINIMDGLGVAGIWN